MDANEVRKQLSYFLGLDDETIDQQIVPMLANLKSRAELQEQLTNLIGNDMAQTSFIRAYAESRFPPAAKAAPSKGSPSTSTASASTRRPGPPSSATQLSATSNKPVKPLQPIPAPSVNIACASASTSRASSPLPPSPGPLLSKPPSGSSETVQAALLVIERRIRSARGQGKRIACFCQGNLHPLSPTTSICPRCLLILCDLNVPYNSSCPSCSLTPLANQSVLDGYAHAQEVERDQIIRGEIERLRLESEEEERIRRSIQFPTLEGANAFGVTHPTAAAGYASKAAGVDHYRQIDNAYKAHQAREAADAARGERKVLRLDPKTKKAKMVTTTVSKKTTNPQTLQKKDHLQDDFLHDPRTPYIDELDDGIRKREVRVAKQRGGQEGDTKLDWPVRPSGLMYQPTGLSSGVDIVNSELALAA